MARSTYVVRTSIEIKVVHGNGVLLPPLELFFGTVPSPDLDVDRAREDADPNLIVSLRTFMAVTISS